VAEARCDVLVVGGSLGGVAAALRAGRAGARVILVEESGWLGGQISAQGVCTPDENRWIETTGGTASYLDFRERTREYYRTSYRLSDAGLSQLHLNVGSCWVSRLAVEPKAARDILASMLADLSNVEVRLHSRVVEVENRINTIHAVTVQSATGALARILPGFVLDATELGDLLPLAGAEHLVGAESRAETGEPDAPEQARQDWIQPFTIPFALELRPDGEDHTIAAPPDYAELKELQRYHILDGAMRGTFGELGWWTYRRAIAAGNFDDPAFACDVAMINTGSNDFKGGVIPRGEPDLDSETLAQARRASLGYVYWLQTECPREDDPSRRGYPELKLRADWFDTEDGLAPHPYIRESRRIRAVKTVVEQEIVAADSYGIVHQPGPRATIFHDSVGIGHYWLDIHDGGTDEPSRFLETKPFQIPLGALIPVRITNLLPACKNLGVTHLANGAYRLHPIEWNVGESAGALAAFCSAEGLAPRAVLDDSRALRRFQRVLLEAGVPLYWWTDLPRDHPAFLAAQALAIEEVWPGGDSLEFQPDEPMTDNTAALLAARTGLGAEAMLGRTRGECAEWIYDSLHGDGWSD
jgi:hypothetical protein